MSDYGRIVTTNQGKNMITNSIRTHSAIIFTKISLGDGLLNGETIETMTGLKHRLMDGNVPKINHLGNGEIEAVSTVSNSELTAGFFARELGLFAKLGEEGEEQLFAYTNAGSNASYIPPNTSVDEKMLGIQLGVGDAVVQVNYQSHLYITYEQLEDGISHHNTDILSHPDIIKVIAEILGATDWQENPVSNLKEIKNLLGQGAIVASKLDANAGFVKYANGFTTQWGRDNYDSDENSHWVTFPTAFGECFSVIPCIIGGSSDSIKIYNINNIGFEKVSYYNFQSEHSTVSRPCLWLAVGKA